MRKSFLFGAALVTALLVSSVASADEEARVIRLGLGADVGVPSGASIGIVACDNYCAFRAQVSMTYNAMNLGGRASIKLDPLALFPRNPVGLFFDLQGGIAGQGSIPGTTNLPPLGYDYLNFYGGLRFGRARNFHWLLEVGPTMLVANTSNFQHYVDNNGTTNVKVSNPKVSAWIVPTFVTGFEIVW
jgi:hypothetical protein